MSKLEHIEYVLNSDFLAPDQGKFEEIQANMVIPIKSDGCRYRSYKYDKDMKGYPGGLFPFFSHNEKVRKISDYIVFAENGNQFYVLMLELKRGKGDTLPQLKAAECFANFLVNSVKRVKSISIEPQIRFISIPGFRRKKTTGEKPVQYDANNHTEFRDQNFRLKAFLI